MKISTMIQQLERIKNEYGNLEVVYRKREAIINTMNYKYIDIKFNKADFHDLCYVNDTGHGNRLYVDYRIF